MYILWERDCNNAEKYLDMNTSDARNWTGTLPNKRRVSNCLYHDELKVHQDGGSFLPSVTPFLTPTVGMTMWTQSHSGTLRNPFTWHKCDWLHFFIPRVGARKAVTGGRKLPLPWWTFRSLWNRHFATHLSFGRVPVWFLASVVFMFICILHSGNIWELLYHMDLFWVLVLFQ